MPQVSARMWANKVCVWDGLLYILSLRAKARCLSETEEETCIRARLNSGPSLSTLGHCPQPHHHRLCLEVVSSLCADALKLVPLSKDAFLSKPFWEICGSSSRLLK